MERIKTMTPKPQNNMVSECPKDCAYKDTQHGHCIHCGALTQPIMECKCPERQPDGSWRKPTPAKGWEEEVRARFKFMIDAGISDGIWKEEVRTPMMFVCRGLIELIHKVELAAEKRMMENPPLLAIDEPGAINISATVNQAVDEENLAWREGRRCMRCGAEKPVGLVEIEMWGAKVRVSMCENCVEDETRKGRV